MLSIESFIADFRRTAEGRIPAEVLEPRLREIRSHLQSAAEERGEIEAVRQFGKPQQLANEMIRTHRGYVKQSAAKLSKAVCTGLYGALVLPNVCIALPFYRKAWLPMIVLVGVSLLIFALGSFWLRAFVTRRWIVLPALVWTAAAAVSIFALRSVRSNNPSGHFPPFLMDRNFLAHLVAVVERTVIELAVILVGLNGLALGLGAATDRRQVRHA